MFIVVSCPWMTFAAVSSWGLCFGEEEIDVFGDCSSLLECVKLKGELNLELGYVEADEGVEAGEKYLRISVICSSILFIFCLRPSISSFISRRM